MTERIARLAQMTLRGEMFPTPTKTDYDRCDLFLSKTEREVKRICEYIENQTPVLNRDCALTGLLAFDGSCVGDAFNVAGHAATSEAIDEFYLKHIDGISVMEWQHATGDYRKVLTVGISGMAEEIDRSLSRPHGEDGIAFLRGLRRICASIIRWAHKCSDAARALAASESEEAVSVRLSRLADALLHVPEHPARTFFEGVLCMNLCYSFNPDSFGLLDRYLKPLYDEDLASGRITREEAKELLQEFLLTPQARNSKSIHATKGGQSHFCIGGYTREGEDGFTELSRLIVESLMELPTYIPEISFRWTPKTRHEDFRFIMDCERKDRFKRIAFTNDERRVHALCRIGGLPFEKAIEYTLVGCNELAFPGAISASTSKGNLLKTLENLFHEHAASLACADTFDAFYELFEKELYSVLDLIFYYDDQYNLCRARDVSYVSSLFFNDCVENARSLTQGGTNMAISSPMLLGIVNLIDSVTAVKQTVYDEKRISMEALTDALQKNWEGYEELRLRVQKRTDYFGDGKERSNAVARRIYHSIYTYLYGKRTVFGYPTVMGDHTGYNEHFRWFGEVTRATPDGRASGDPLKFGLFQRGHADMSLTAHLGAIAQADPDGIGCGSTVTNISVDMGILNSEERFEKLVLTMEAFFRQGGMQFQLNHVSRKELLDAKNDPWGHADLRVRVTGFSEYFVKLPESFQDEIIRRTE